MRMNQLRLPMLLVSLAGVVSAQATLTPRRVSGSFTGEVPFLWSFEGTGQLVSARLRLLDEGGVEVFAPTAFNVRPLGGRLWQAAESWVPSQRLKAMPAGRYLAEWTLTWSTAGGARTEKTESVFRICGTGDGWLQQAFHGNEGEGFSLNAGAQWMAGVPYRISIPAPGSPKAVRYQLIEEATETTLVKWQDLPLGKGTSWTLPFGKDWPSGPAQLWIQMEDAAGRTWVHSRDVVLGKVSRAGGVPSQAQALVAVKGTTGGAASAKLLTGGNPPTWTTLSWLDPLDRTPTLPWGATNRIATVNAGYVDEERNATNLWPTDAGRPMSLSLTGADQLGKPLYTVSYLLADRASAATTLYTYAQQALGVSDSAANLPPGASALSVGNVLAPVIMSPGVVEDFLGKPLAAGYPWAANNAGVPVSAKDWAGASTSTPELGLAAMRKAADLRWRMLSDGITLTGYAGSESISLDAGRDPYGITVASQDATGRPLLQKGLGSPTQTGAIIAIQANSLNLSCTFAGALPRWIQVNGSAYKDVASGAEDRLVLDPPVAATNQVPSTVRFKNVAIDDSYTDAWSSNQDNPAGAAIAMLGRATPQSTLTATFKAKGPLSAYWILDGKDDDSAVLAGTWNDATPTEHTLTLSSAVQLSAPTQVAIKLINKNSQVTSAQVDDSTRVFISSVALTADSGVLGLQVDSSAMAHAVVPGFTRTQYGTVAIQGQGRCTVTMVTDPDGSAVAEVKDPEGRTVYKIVNPTAAYTAQFIDSQNSAFQPSDPKSRGGAANATVTAVQKDLVTQYVFDDEGHLRIVIPPKGLSGSAGGWGAAQSDSNVVNALAWQGAPVGSGSPAFAPIPYATHNAYDGSGHLVATYNPDEGLTLFKVDQKGRVHLSQTESQRSNKDSAGNTRTPTWTRTLYDAIFRVIAVGETTTVPSDLEAVTSSTYTADLATLSTAYLSKNFYDTYLDDPSTDVRLDAKVRAQLPDKATLWGSFADGHLVQTSDARTTERYYYDQDGRIVIRWVSITGAAGTTSQFAIGIFYDFAGRVKRLVYPAGPGGDPLQVVYTYDDLGRLFAVGTPVDKGYFARYVYHPTGELRSIIYGPGDGFVAKRMLQDPQGWLRQVAVQGK